MSAFLEWRKSGPPSRASIFRRTQKKYPTTDIVPLFSFNGMIGPNEEA